MNEFVYELTLDLNCAKTPPVICSGQFDKGRKFEFTVTANGEPYDVTGCSAVLKGVRTDGSHFAVECTVSNGKITKTLDDTTLSVRGKTVAKLVISDSEKSYSTQMFIIDVDSALDGDITVADDYSILNRLIEQIHALNESGAILIDDTIDKNSNNAVANKAVAIALAQKADKSATYTKTEVDTALNKKPDKATTLDGYGITNGENSGNKITDKSKITDENANYPSIKYLHEYYYDFETVDNLLENKADAEKTDVSIGELKNLSNIITGVNYEESALMSYESTNDALGKNQYSAVIAPNETADYFIKSAKVKASVGKKITFSLFEISQFYENDSLNRKRLTKKYVIKTVDVGSDGWAKIIFDVPLLISSGNVLVATCNTNSIYYGTYKDGLYNIFNYNENWSSLLNGESSKIAWVIEDTYSPSYALEYVLKDSAVVETVSTKEELSLKRSVNYFDDMINQNSDNAVKNSVLYQELNIIEKEIIEPKQLSYLNGNKNTVSFQNRSAVRILVPETELFTIQRIDVNCKTGVDVYFGLWTFRRMNDNYDRGYFTLEKNLGVVTSVENHATLELNDLEIDQNIYHILACTKENALGLLSEEVVSPKESWSIYNDYSLANTEVGSECSSLYYFTPVYSGSEATGYTPAYSVSYTLKNSKEVVTVTNVKEKVKELMKGGGSGGDTPVATVGNVLAGKKWAACGDSVTMGIEEVKDEEGNYRTYEYFIAKRNGMVLYKDGISGSTMTSGIAGKENIAFSLDRYKDIPLDCDYITIWFGINDSTMSAPLGDISSTDKNTFYGAWNVVMKYIITNIPKAKIGLVVTHMGGVQYHQAVRDIAKKYGVSVFDIPQDPKIPFWCPASSYFSETIDSEISALRNAQWWVGPSHPSIEGYEYISYPFENWMRSL